MTGLTVVYINGIEAYTPWSKIGIFPCSYHRDDVINWKHFLRYWPFVRRIHRSQRPVTRSFDVFFDLRLNKRLSKQSWGWWFETPSHPLWRHCNGKSNAGMRIIITFNISNSSSFPPIVSRRDQLRGVNKMADRQFADNFFKRILLTVWYIDSDFTPVSSVWGNGLALNRSRHFCLRKLPRFLKNIRSGVQNECR